MSKTIFFILFIFYSILGISQISENPDLEKDVKLSLQYIDEYKSNNDNEYIEKLKSHTKSIIGKYDLNCEQKARVYQKLGTIYWLEGTNYKKINEYLRDSTLLIWKNCDIVNPNKMWSPSFYLFRFFITENRLQDANIIFNIINETPNIQNDVPIDWVMDFYKLAGVMYYRLGDEILSDQNFQKALHILNNNDVGPYAFDVHNTYAFSLSHFNRFEESEEQFLLAQKVSTEAEDEALLAINYSNVYLKQGKYSDAENLLLKVTQIVDTLSDKRFRPNRFKQLAKSYIGLNNLEKASIALDSSLILNQKIKSVGEISKVLGLMGKVAGKKENFELVDQLFEKAVNYQIPDNKAYSIFDNESQLFNKPILDYTVILAVLKDYLEVYSDKFELTHSEDDLKKVLKIIDELDKIITDKRGDYNSEYSKLEQLKDSYFIYEKGIENCVAYYTVKNEKKYLEKAYELSAKNKSSTLASLQYSRDVFSKTLPEDLYLKLSSLETKKREIESDLFSDSNNDKNKVNNTYLGLMNELNEFKQNLSKQYPEIAKQLKENQTNISFQSIQKSLPKHARLIDIFYGTENIYLFNISKNNISLESIPNSKDLQAEYKQYSSWTKENNSSTEYHEISQHLYNTIYMKTFNKFKGTPDESIFIMSDGLLHNMPVEAFWMGDKYVVEKYNISYFYTLDQLLQSHKIEFLPDSYIGFGSKYSESLNAKLDSDYGLMGISLPNLNYAEKEINDNSQIYKGEVFIGEKASKQNFLDFAINEDNIIHTALHGIILDENTSAIIFDNRNEDILLSSNEVYSLRLKNDLTILSACYSASGKIYDGEGARSLGRSFLYAGSKNILSSLWAASDQATENVISNFLAGVKNKQSLQHALTKAKRDYLRTASPAYRHPSYWANMVLIGSSKHTQSPSLYYGIILGGLLLLALTLIFFFRKKTRKKINH